MRYITSMNNNKQRHPKLYLEIFVPLKYLSELLNIYKDGTIK